MVKSLAIPGYNRNRSVYANRGRMCTGRIARSMVKVKWNHFNFSVTFRNK